MPIETKPYHHPNLQVALIEAGIRQMNKDGYERLSLRKIAAECGVSHSAPYRHFKDKDGLLTAMQIYVEEQFTEVLQQAVEEYSSVPHPMVEFGKAYVRFFAAYPEYYAFFINQENYYVEISEATNHVHSNYRPFTIFKEQALFHMKANGVPEKMYLVGMAAMWATVHGLAGMATMAGVHYDGEWDALTEKVLLGVMPDE